MVTHDSSWRREFPTSKYLIVEESQSWRSSHCSSRRLYVIVVVMSPVYLLGYECRRSVLTNWLGSLIARFPFDSCSCLRFLAHYSVLSIRIRAYSNGLGLEAFEY